MRWIIILILGFAIGAPAEIYEWTDEDGNRHFSDSKPPEGIEYRIRGADEGRLSTYSSSIRPAPAQPPRLRGSSAPRQREAPAGSVADQNRLIAIRCQQYLDRMDWIQSRLRAGYREPYGNALRRERREISTKYFRECR